VSRPDPAPADRSKLLGRDYWLLLSTPAAGTTAADIEAHIPAHLSWLLGLERDGTLFLSGPLLSGPGTAPGSGMTVLRAADEAAAREIGEADPFVRAGLRKFDMYRWRLNEGSVAVRLSLGTGAYEWS
jgi:uncharacterized protein YciI